jgi:hypothetical protein
MTDRYRETRQSAQDRQFKDELLAVLNRIAVALENPLVEYTESPQPIDPIARSVRRPVVLDQAMVCTCGNDPKKACTQCTPARLAWVYSQEET